MAPKPPDSVEGLRVAGNQSFRNGQYSEASALYSRALRMLRARGSSDPEEESVLFSNRAACHLKDGNCTDCIKDCTSSLALVPFGIKPLLRRATAYETLEKYPLAYVDYMTVLQIDCTVTSALEGINRMTRALKDSLGPEWRLKLPPIPSVPVSAQKRWDLENHKENAKTKSKETTSTKNKVPSGNIERAKVLKEEGNELVKKGNHKKAIEKYSESLSFSNLESATYTNSLFVCAGLSFLPAWMPQGSLASSTSGSKSKCSGDQGRSYKTFSDLSSEIALCPFLSTVLVRVVTESAQIQGEAM
ncbi:mitochondrial import receptor subunit TOM34 isoform X3 [Dasypus novemcinctus]|uniref:mitochondrial import receptor subunit TOM34 isoform X3 n=1 Tax=Dasypus novemcinctus TaxID=9361 RepID=UPI00265EE839|nr:mitochondrial import receptor subunit TOM34 isoform X3 [Dasypus novemcinctus]